MEKNFVFYEEKIWRKIDNLIGIFWSELWIHRFGFLPFGLNWIYVGQNNLKINFLKLSATIEHILAFLLLVRRFFDPLVKSI